MTYPTRTQAQDFFAQLRRFSRRALAKVLPGVPDGSTNSQDWRGGHARGAIGHYTASGNWASPVRWFNQNRQSSAHVVVAHHLDPICAGLADDFPLVRALPVTVIQCVEPTRAAWHATWANGLCYGIENRNAGMVKRDDANSPWRHWPPAKGNPNEWTSRAPSTGQAYVATSDTIGYEPYSKAQLVANVMILRYVGALNGAPLEPQWVLPHSAVQLGKFDTGPLFPIHEIRRLACVDVDADPAAELASLTEPEDATSADDLDGVVYAAAEPRHDGVTLAEREAVDAAIAGLAMVEARPPMRQHPFAAVARGQLDVLGFFVPRPSDPRDLDPWLCRALWIFQTGAKLPTSNEPDRETRIALAARLAQLGLVA